MICYTLSDCVLRNINTDSRKKEIITDLLMVFPQENNPHKVVIDRTGKIIEIYNEVIDSSSNPAILYWLQLMGDFPQSWEPVDIDNIEQVTINREVFLMVCSQTEDKMMIVHNHNGWTKGKYCHKRNILHNDAIVIRVLDRDEAIKLLALSEEDAVKEIDKHKEELKSLTINNITYQVNNGILATNGSRIDDIQIQK
ncbi:MAG: hypothetical protein LBL07_03735 [Tannerella sp.]|jgi:hypothetical protein|nr:hypothetical protein [Tannerella sp.]